MKKKPFIVVSGLNPAWQKTLFFEKFKPGTVNRAASVKEEASGKGINFIRAARTWGKVDSIVLQFAGGWNGERLLADLDREGLSHRTVRFSGETRCCSTVLDLSAHSMTELIEPTSRIPDSSVNEMFFAFCDILSSADALALCGTYPPGVPDDFYVRLAQKARDRHVFLFIDAFIGIEKTLAGSVDLLKINLDELYALSGETSPESAFRACFRKFRIGTLAVTDGKNPAFFSSGHAIEQIPVPVIDAPLNPIGSGDTCSSVMLSEILAGSSHADAFRYGLAAASANCLTEFPASFAPSIALELFQKGFPQNGK